MKTAVVILNWNGLNFLKKFLPTLIKNTENAQIIVIDNKSTDESVDYLKKEYPAVEIIVNKENGGYAKGYNDGLREIEGRFEYYALINSDIEVTANWLQPLVEKLDRNDKIAGVQPKIMSFVNKNLFEHAGASGGFIDKNFYPFCRGRIFHAVEEDKSQYDNETEVFWTSGACMLIRASVFHKLYGFDEDFFAHMEEIDFCWRAKRQSYSFYVVPSSKVYHVGGGTLSYETPRKTYLNFRNSLFMIHKNYDGWLLGKIIWRLELDGMAALRMLLSLKLKHFFAVVKAHFAYYGSLPKLRGKRKKLNKENIEFNKAGIYKASVLWAFFFKKITKFKDLNKRFFAGN